MKFKNISLILFISFFVCSRCSKQKGEQLPPETQTGAGTLGFTIDGKVYRADFPDALSSYIYENFPFPNQQGYFLTISGENRTNWIVGLLTDSLKIFQGQTYMPN